MWRLAPGYGFGVIKGSKFSTIPSGYSINVITPYGFEIGPLCTITYLLHLENIKQNTESISVDEIGVTIGDTLLSLNPFYIGIGGDLNFFESFYSEGHHGIIGSGFGFRGFWV